MARLNDYAAPAESVDALKRRFVRQNREIMRVNSMQSMRIRSLESEVSHLLSENVSLRGQIITLTQENERLDSAKALQSGVYEIKARLDAKMAELNGLVSDLGALPRKAGKMFKDRSFDANSDRLKMAEAPPRANDPDYNAEIEDGKLPAILEDKYFPRKTLEPQEVHELVEGDSCMPESPLMHHLEPATTTAIEDTTRSDEIPLENKFNLSPSPEAYLPATLETRKKKRRPEVAAASSDNEVESVGHTATATSKAEVEADTNTGTCLKFGSKRKFSLDDDALFDLAPEDDFQFSRLSRSPQKQKDTFQFLAQESSSSPSKTPVNMKRGSANTTKRKVLEPKSANSNLASPKKSRASQVDSKSRQKLGRDENMPSQTPKEMLSQTTKPPSARPRGRPPSLMQKPKRANQSITEDAVSSQPKTKITAAVVKDSPIAKSRESMEDMSDETGVSRPSRRRGAVVSYAEPSLRAKMRRSTKDMADAVADRRSSSFQLGRESLDGDDQFVERSENEDRSRSRSRTPGHAAVLPDVLSDGGSDTIAVSRRRRKVSTATDELLPSDKDERSTREPARQSRRHSSNPKSAIVDDEWSSQADSSFDNDDVWKLPAAEARETRIGARRRSMMV